MTELRHLFDVSLGLGGALAVLVAIGTVVANLITGGLHDLNNRSTTMRKRNKTSTINQGKSDVSSN